jgi:AcrR family transcriptional regulator
MPNTSGRQPDVVDAGLQFRSQVAAAALQLCAEKGFEATSAEDIARAAGISRSTFFRQFRSKEDVIFADHDELLERAAEILSRHHDDPWMAVCEAALLVFRHYAEQGERALLRYQVVNAVPALRDKELVTVFRYDRLFNNYLRRSLPGLAPLDRIRFTAAIIATNNFFLRDLMRGGEASMDDVRTALDDVRRLHGVLGEGAGATPDEELVLAVFPRSMPAAEIARQLKQQLDARHGHPDTPSH